MWDVDLAKAVLLKYDCQNFAVDAGGNLHGLNSYGAWVAIAPADMMVLNGVPTAQSTETKAQ